MPFSQSLILHSAFLISRFRTVHSQQQRRAAALQDAPRVRPPTVCAIASRSAPALWRFASGDVDLPTQAIKPPAPPLTRTSLPPQNSKSPVGRSLPRRPNMAFFLTPAPMARPMPAYGNAIRKTRPPSGGPTARSMPFSQFFIRPPSCEFHTRHQIFRERQRLAQTPPVRNVLQQPILTHAI